MAEKVNLRLLPSLGFVVIVIAGLKAAATILIPILTALFFTLICIPPVHWLRRRGVPNGVAIGLIVLAVVVVVGALTGVVGNSVSQFTNSLDKYRTQFDALIHDSAVWLKRYGVDVPEERVAKMVDTGRLLELMRVLLQGVLSVLSDIVVIVFIMIFMLVEATGFAGKLRRALGDPEADLGKYAAITDQVYGYISIKAGVSFVTGLLCGGICAASGVDFPVLWGLVAFLFNFVPNVGSIIAAIPPVLLALIAHGIDIALVVAVGYLVVNMVIGNIIEPRIMGRRLGLSPLIVILSLLFWSWVWGPVGMVLSLPLTMVVKVALEHGTESSRALAILLGPVEEADVT